MELQKGMTPYSPHTFDCDDTLCTYNTDGRCIYNVARLQISVGRACHDDLVQAEMEARLDYLDGWG